MEQNHAFLVYSLVFKKKEGVGNLRRTETVVFLSEELVNDDVKRTGTQKNGVL